VAKTRISLLLANGLAEDATEQPDVLAERQIALWYVTFMADPLQNWTYANPQGGLGAPSITIRAP